MQAGSEGRGVLESYSRACGNMIFKVSRIPIPRMFGVFSRLSFSRVLSKLFSVGTRFSWKLLSFYLVGLSWGLPFALLGFSAFPVCGSGLPSEPHGHLRRGNRPQMIRKELPNRH